MSTSNTPAPDTAAVTTGPGQNESVMPDQRRPTSRWLRALSVMGPAFIVGAWQFGPGNLLSAVQAGTAHGYTLIWVIALSTILMLAFTDMSVRIALRSTTSLISTIKDVSGDPSAPSPGSGSSASP